MTPVVIAEIEAEPRCIRRTRPRSSTVHFDKQPPLGDWRAGLGPYSPVRDGDRLYGRGTADDGYAVFAAFAAIEALQRTARPHGRIRRADREGAKRAGVPISTPTWTIWPADIRFTGSRRLPRFGLRDLRPAVDDDLASRHGHRHPRSRRAERRGPQRSAGGIDAFLIPYRPRTARPDRGRPYRGNSHWLSSIASCRHIAEVEIADGLAEEIGPDAAGVFPTDRWARAHRRHHRGTDRERDLAGVALGDGTGRPPPLLGQAGNVLRPSTSLKLSVRLPPNVDAQPPPRRRYRQALLCRSRRPAPTSDSSSSSLRTDGMHPSSPHGSPRPSKRPPSSTSAGRRGRSVSADRSRSWLHSGAATPPRSSSRPESSDRRAMRTGRMNFSMCRPRSPSHPASPRSSRRFPDDTTTPAFFGIWFS